MTKIREPSSVIEMVEMTQDMMLSISRGEHGSDADLIRDAKIILDILPAVDFYEISDEVYRAATDLFVELYQDKKIDEIRLDKDTRLPSEWCGFWWSGSTVLAGPNRLRVPVMFIARALGPFEVGVIMLGPNTIPVSMGAYSAGEEQAVLIPPEAKRNNEDQYYAAATLHIAGLCSVINQPSFVVTTPAGSRQQRRAAQRAGGYAPTAWHKVSWNIGEAAKAKITRDEPTRCMPLHYTRGHWRKAEEGWNNVERRKDGLWYQWIEGYWSGHPAFGVKRSYHAPKMARAG